MTAWLYILASALLHALWNGQLKTFRNSRVAVTAIFLISGLLATLLTFSLNQTALGGNAGFAAAIIAGIFEAGYGIFLAISFERGAMAWAYAVIRGVAMLVVWAISIVTLHETFGWQSTVGVMSVAVGLALLHNLTGNWRSTLKNPAPYLSALCIGGANLSYKTALNLGAMSLPLFAVAMWVSIPLLLMFQGRGAFRELTQALKQSPNKMVLAAVLCTLSFVFFLIGMKQTGAGYATTVRNSSVVFAQLIGLTLGERVSKRQWLGVGWILIGVSCL